IVDRAAARTIGIGEWIALREEVALLVQRTKRFITDLMIDQHEFPEVGTSAVLDNGLPAARGRGGIARTQRLEVAGAARLDDERAEEAHHGQFTIVAEGMELPDTLLRARMDVPFILAALVLGDNRIGVGGRRRGTGRAHDHGRAMDVEADVLAAFQLVAELDLDAVALVAADDQRLNPLR